MRYPQVADIDEMQAVPITEKHVKKHAALTKEEGLRQQSFEDCCSYCDVHHNKRLSAGKHNLIQAWTTDVNATMAHVNTQRSPSSATRGQKGDKAKYAKYVPPGRPDVDRGFRMIPKPLHMRRQPRRVDGNHTVSKKGHGRQLENLVNYGESQFQKDRAKLAHHVVSLSQHYFEERQSLETNTRRVKSAHSATRKNPTSEQTGLHNEDSQSPSPAHEHKDDCKGDDNMVQHPAKAVHTEVPAQNEVSTRVADPGPKTLHIEIPTDHSTKYMSELASDRSNSNRTTQLGTRTTSNRLLNIISIDDAFRQHRGTLAATSPWIGPKLVERDTLGNMTSRAGLLETQLKPAVTEPTDKQSTIRGLHQTSLLTISEDLSEGQKPATPNKGGSSNIYVETITATNSHDNPNGAVLKGFESLEKATEATNNTAYTGLYKFDESCRQPLNLSRGSKRFSRMNRNLQQMVEAFHLHGTPLSRKIQQRKHPQEEESSATSSRPQSASSQASYKFTSTPKFKVGKQAGGGRDGQRLTSPEENSTTEDGRESFLEMIMDMDQRRGKEDREGSTTVHTYLYV